MLKLIPALRSLGQNSEALTYKLSLRLEDSARNLIQGSGSQLKEREIWIKVKKPLATNTFPKEVGPNIHHRMVPQI